MSDLERRLRATVVQRSEGFEPSDDLADRIGDRVRRRHVQRRAIAAGLVATAAAVLVVAGLAVAGGDETGSIRMADDSVVPTPPTSGATPSTVTTPGSTTSTAGDGTTSTTASTTSTSTAPPTSPTVPAIDALTPLSRPGIGPIRAGMTLRQAQEAGGVTLVPSGTGGSCFEARFQGIDPAPLVIVEAAGGDPMDGVVRAVQGSVLPTDEGAIVGQSRAELLAALGSPTRTEQGSATWGADADLLVFESGGFAYGAVVVDDMVLGLQSGDPAWVSADEGCPA